MNKFTAIYVRRSVSDADKGNNSLPIEAQKEECIRFLGGDANYKMYCDDGKAARILLTVPIWKPTGKCDTRDCKIVKWKSQKKLDRRSV